MSVDHIRYDLLTQQALRAVVRRVLSDVAKVGSLPGEHHFYVTFDTRAPGVRLSARMRAKNLKPGASSYQDARVAAAFQNASGTRISNWLAGPTLRADSPGWMQRTVTLDIPPDAKTLYLQLALLNATGQVDFDDVSVVPQVAK